MTRSHPCLSERRVDFCEIIQYPSRPYCLTHHRFLPSTENYNMVQTAEDGTVPKFHGANWIDLNRMIALATFQFLQDDDYTGDEARKCAYLASRFEGAALDWVAARHTTNPTTLFTTFDEFIRQVRQAFGIADNNITAILRHELDALKWSSDVPVFFAEFDRITLGLGIQDHSTKIATLNAKLPQNIKEKFAEQALAFENYETMRERLVTMWALNPHRPAAGALAGRKQKRKKNEKKKDDLPGTKN